MTPYLPGLAPVTTPETSDDWYTPLWLLEVVEAMGEIDLDPCWSPGSLVHARRVVALPEDGLAVAWRRRVWLNPPYSRPEPWVLRARDVAAQGDAEVTGLVPTRHSARWWRRAVLGTARCQLHGRVKFGRPGNRVSTAIFDCSVVYWGQRAEFFGRIFKAYGEIIGP